MDHPIDWPRDAFGGTSTAQRAIDLEQVATSAPMIAEAAEQMDGVSIDVGGELVDIGALIRHQSEVRRTMQGALDLAVSRGCSHCADSIRRARAVASLPTIPDQPLAVEQAWQVLCEKDDRTSPADQPDMCLITREELADFMATAHPAATTEKTAPVAVEGAPERIWLVDDKELLMVTDWPNPDLQLTEYIRADLTPTALVDAGERITDFRMSVSLAAEYLSQHMERHHDTDEDPSEEHGNLINIHAHLMGTLIGDEDAALASRSAGATSREGGA